MKINKIKFPLGPIRTCIVCNAKRPKHDLVRLGVVDACIVPQQKGTGRGVYLCADHPQVKINKKRKRIAHLLGCKLDYELSLSRGSGV